MKLILCVILALSLSPYVQAGDAEQATKCMLKVLKNTPGVSEPVAGEYSKHRETFPFVEYRAAERTQWTQPMRFTLRSSKDGRVRFEALVPGLMTPGEKFETHITDSVVKKWRAQCKVDVDVLFAENRGKHQALSIAQR